MPMLDLTDKVALVTGASRGIGRGVAESMGAAGAIVVASDIRDASATASAITEAGGRVESAALDVTAPASVQTLVDEVLDRHGRIDILVNNAGIALDQLMLRMKPEAWDRVIATNLTSVFTCVQAVLKPMVRQRSGRIITISSVVGQTGNAGQANYAASKAGVIGFSKSVAREVASRNVTVNLVAPGFIDTDMTKSLAKKAQTDWTAQIPLGRMGSVADVVAAVRFLASDEASYITGHVLAVNGGMYM
jgi:3-oxoacyl-[acyl-carrier protein] reductase